MGTETDEKEDEKDEKKDDESEESIRRLVQRGLHHIERGRFEEPDALRRERIQYRQWLNQHVRELNSRAN